MAKEENTNIEQDEALSSYETQFNKENIIALKEGINRGINAYVKDEKNGEKLDVFLILSALQQTAFELAVRVFPKDKEDHKNALEQMSILSDKHLELLDTNRNEKGTKALDELLATIHTASIVTEFYAKRRDEYLTAVADKSLTVDEQE